MAACLQRGIGIEVMTNAAAARTFNVLAGEGRAWWRVSSSAEVVRLRNSTADAAPADAWRRSTRRQVLHAGRPACRCSGSRNAACRARRRCGPSRRSAAPAFTQLAFVHQALAVVAVGRQPLVAVLDDHQFAVADQAGAGIHDHAVGGRAHGLPALPAMSMPCRVGSPGTKRADHAAVRRPAPGERCWPAARPRPAASRAGRRAPAACRAATAGRARRRRGATRRAAPPGYSRRRWPG